MSQSDSVAVVIPSHDRPTLLRRAIASVVTQTPPPAELVVVDVGGRSGAQTIAVPPAGDLRYKAIVAPAGSTPGAARNIGMAAVSSPRIAFLDDDDEWAPGYLHHMMLAATETDSDVALGRIVLRLEDRRQALDLVRLPLAATGVLLRNPGFTGSNLVVKGSALARIGGWDPSLPAFNDLDLLVRFLQAGASFAIAEDAVVEQTIHGGGQATAASAARLAALDEYLRKHADLVVGTNRRLAARERHRIQKHLAPTRSRRVWHLACDLALTSPQELRVRVRRRLSMGGGYD